GGDGGGPGGGGGEGGGVKNAAGRERTAAQFPKTSSNRSAVSTRLPQSSRRSASALCTCLRVLESTRPNLCSSNPRRRAASPSWRSSRFHSSTLFSNMALNSSKSKAFGIGVRRPRRGIKTRSIHTSTALRRGPSFGPLSSGTRRSMPRLNLRPAGTAIFSPDFQPGTSRLGDGRQQATKAEEPVTERCPELAAKRHRQISGSVDPGPAAQTTKSGIAGGEDGISAPIALPIGSRIPDVLARFPDVPRLV